jgi:hypothetical protein
MEKMAEDGLGAYSASSYGMSQAVKYISFPCP